MSKRPLPSRPRLVILTQWFDPEPHVRGLAFASRLAAAGFAVEVVTGFPNYPGGRLYPGYAIRPLSRGQVDGITLTRLALYPSHDRSRIGRSLNYLSFWLSALLYLLLMRRADIVYAYHPPATVGFAAALARLVRRMPVVLEIQDMWPDTLRATGMISSDRLLGLIGRVCLWTYRRVDAISVISEGFRALLLQRGIAPERISVIPNWAGDGTIGTTPEGRPEAFAEPGLFRVLFAGNMGLAQGLDAVLDAAAIVARTAPRVRFCMLGAGLEQPRLRQRAESLGLANIVFLPRVPMSEVGAFLAGADCLLVHLRDDPLFAITVPSKTQAYLAAGRPIVMAVAGDAARIVEEAGAGVTVPPENAPALAAAILDLAARPAGELEAMGAAGRRYYAERMAIDRGVAAFARLLRRVAAQELEKSPCPSR